MPMNSNVFPSFSCTSFNVSGLILRPLIHIEWYLCRVKDTDLVSVFCMQISVFPSTYMEETIFSPSFVFGAFVRNQVGIAAWFHTWVSYSVTLIFLPVFVSVQCWFYWYYSVVLFEVRYCDISSVALFAQ
jgi:hypothetical protein